MVRNGVSISDGSNVFFFFSCVQCLELNPMVGPQQLIAPHMITSITHQIIALDFMPLPPQPVIKRDRAQRLCIVRLLP